MKRLGRVTILGLVLIFSSYAQELEKVIYLPDSFAGLKGADRIAVVPWTGEVYIASTTGDGITVFDGITGEKRARIGIPAGVARMCYVPAESSIYCAGAHSDTVYVINPAAHQIIQRIPVGGKMEFLTYNPLRNKLYLSGRLSGGLLTVIDCSINQVVARLVLNGATGATAHQCRFDRLFCHLSNRSGSQLAIIECATDSLIDSILLGEIQVEQLLINPVANKLYAVASATGDIVIADLWTGQLLKHWVVARAPWAMCLNPDRNKLYIALKDDSALLVIDGELDSIINTVELATRPAALVYDPNHDLLYISGAEPSLTALNCSTDSISWTMNYPGAADSIYFAPELNRIYTIQYDSAGGRDAAIVNPQTRTVNRVPLLFYINWALYAQAGEKLYLSGTVAGSRTPLVVSIDGSNSTIASQILIPDDAGFIADNEPANKLYVHGESLLTVIDGATDSIIKTIPCPAPGGFLNRLFYNPAGNRLFAIDGNDSVLVIDAGADTVLTKIYAPHPQAFGFNPVRNRIYISGTQALTIVDGTTGALINRLPGNFGVNWCYVPGRDWVLWARERTFQAVGGTSNAIDTAVNVNHTIDALVINPLNRKIYTASDPGGMIYVYAGENLSRLHLFPVPARPVNLQLDLAANLIYCQHAEEAILTLIDADNGNIINTVNTPFALWSPVLNQSRHRFYVLDPKLTGIAVFTMPVPAIAEPASPAPETLRLPRMVRDRLNIPATGTTATGTLLDITGRRVLKLLPGENDLRPLAPGVYFIKLNSGPAVHKIIHR
ncbi:MAG: hypothetical protein ACP5JB_04555 [candidate division WOR-3 bacterium]